MEIHAEKGIREAASRGPNCPIAPEAGDSYRLGYHSAERLSGLGAIVFASAFSLVRFFVPGDDAVILAGGTFLRIVSLSFGFVQLQLALTGVFRASGNMLATMVLALISQWVLQFPLAYVLSTHTSLGANGVWKVCTKIQLPLHSFSLAPCGERERFVVRERDQSAQCTCLH